MGQKSDINLGQYFLYQFSMSSAKYGKCGLSSNMTFILPVSIQVNYT